MEKNSFLEIIKINERRYFNLYKKRLTLAQKKSLRENLEKSIKDERLVSKKLPSGELAYYFIYDCVRMGDLDQEILYFSECYCKDDLENGSKIRRAFYSKIKEISLQIKKTKKVKNMIIEVSQKDERTKNYFKKIGKITYLQLLGSVNEGIKILSKEDVNIKNVTFKSLSKKDLSVVVELSLESHLNDKTSRMYEVFKTKKGSALISKFYVRMLKHKSCVVIRIDKKIAGSFCYFVDEKNKTGLIASVFIAKSFKGIGASKLLYKRMLEVFKEKNLKYYLGASTTHNVLAMAQKLGRVEMSTAIIVRIK